MEPAAPDRHCSQCGRKAVAADRFCGGCGTRLPESPPPVAVPRASIEELFAHLRSGEQRPATILMADISGFTSLGEQVHAEDLYNLLNEIFGELVECLLDYGAHIDKYVGDEVMALFGVPVAQERSAERAVLAALAMRDRLAAMGAAGRLGNVQLSMHIGINIGPVMVGPVGHRSRLDYTVIGDAVNVAKRLEDEAPEGEIYVSEAVRAVLDPRFVLEPVGPVQLKGRRQPVSVFRVTSAPAERVRLSARRSGAVPIRAREAQLARLSDCGEACAGGTARCVGVVGPVGIGKSCLLSEWLLGCGHQQFLVLETGCFPYSNHFPYLAIGDLLAQLAGLRLEGWPPRMIGEPSAAVPLPEEALRSIHWLRQQLGETPLTDDQGDLEGVCEGLLQALQACALQRPVCLVLDDVQWLDEPDRELLLRLLDRAGDWPLYVLFTCREPLPDWVASLGRSDRLALPPLPSAVITELVAAWAAPLPLANDTIGAITDRAQGNPFMARELVNALRGAADADQAAFSLPNSLHELLLAQLDHLPVPLRKLVQAASIVGEPLSPALLAAALGDDHLAEELLPEALRADLLRPGACPGQLVFGRRLLFEAAYETIPPGQRQALHTRIADYLLARADGHDETLLHAAAHHAYAGYHDTRAAEPLLRSARRYWTQYATHQTIRTARQLIEIVAASEGDTGLVAARIEGLVLIAQAHQVLGDLSGAEAALVEAEALLPDCPDEALAARVATSAATLSWMTGAPAEAARQFALAEASWRKLGDDTRVAHALVGRGLCAQELGDDDQALALFMQASEGTHREPWVRAAALNNAGVLLMRHDRHQEAADLIAQGLAANEEAGDRRGIAHSCCSLGEALWRLSQYAPAIEHLARAMALGREIGDAHCALLAAAYLARSHVALDNLAASREILVGIPPAEADQDAEAAEALRQARAEAGLP